MPRTNARDYYEKSELTAVKSFITLAPGHDVIKLFRSVIYKKNYDKLKFFAPSRPSQASLTFEVGWEPTQMKHLSAAPLYGKLLALPRNIRLGWKSLPGTNTLAFNKYSLIMDVKSFITLTPGVNVLKHFFFVVCVKTNKLEHLFGAFLSILVFYLQLRPGPTRAEQLTMGRLLALLKNVSWAERG